MWDTAGPDELKRLTDHIGSGIIVLERTGEERFRILSINERIESVTGLRHADISGCHMDELLREDERERVIERYRRCVETGKTQQYEENLRMAGGAWWRTVLTPIRGPGGQVVRLMGSTIDISDRYDLEERLRTAVADVRESESRLQLALKGGEIGIFEWEVPRRQIRIADPGTASLRLFDGPGEVSSHEWITHVHPEDRAVAVAAGERALVGATSSYTVEYRCRNLEGSWLWLQVHGTVMQYDDDGGPLRICGTYRDITQQKQDREALRKLTAELRHRALHDSLTGVLNHGAILGVLDKEMARAQRDDGVATLALIDVDHFKQVNDGYGHQVGDEILKALVERVSGVLRPYDHLGRYGGEEFVVIAPGGDGFATFYERVRSAVEEAPFATESATVWITVSIGVAVYDGGDMDQAELVLAADRALYRAKATGRNRVILADEPPGEAGNMPQGLS